MKNIALLNLLLIVLCLDPCLYANPFNGIVADGGVSISPSGSLLTISQSSSTAVINWNTFNIANGESTVFEFNGAAGANSAVLNLVSAGNGGSTIAGSLSSTVGHLGPIGGTVLLLNPDGILFTPTAQISVGSLVASTLGLPDQNDFLNRTTLHFNGTSTAGIATQNGASLNALGDIFLIAHTVQNSGVISAGNEAGLAAGTTVTLAQSGLERLTVVAGTGTGTPSGVDNTESGKINAVVTELKAAGGNIYALAINNAGLVRATSLVNENGHVFFRATDATGNQGKISSTGTIAVDGANVPVPAFAVQGSQVTLGGTVNAGAGSVIVTATSGNGVNGTGDIDVNSGTGITAGLVSLHSGTDGAGNISFGGGVTVRADAQSYQAGIGDGSAATASADLTDNNPTFLNQSGNGSPASFTFEQDSTIVDADIPASSQFSLNTPPANYIIQSDGGNLTLDTGANVAGSALTLNAAGTLTIGGNLNLNSLSASGNTVALNGAGGSETVTTIGAQTYNDDVTLGANTTLNGTTLDLFGTLTGGGNNLTLNNSGTATLGNGSALPGGAMTLSGMLGGVNVLTANGSGNLVVNNTISVGSVNDSEATVLNGGSVTTTGGQTYNDVTLETSEHLNGTTLDLLGTVSGSGLNGLLLNNSGTATLGGVVSGIGTLIANGSGNLVVNNTISVGVFNDSETTALNGGLVTTTGTQTYNNAVTLGAATTLSSSGSYLSGNISLFQTVNGAQTLTVNTAGTTTFGGKIGNNQPLTSLTTDAAGTTVLNGGTVNAATADFKDDVILGADTTINELSPDGTTTTFEKTINADLAANNRTLTVQFLTAGGTTFGGAVGNNQALASLTTYSPGGTIAINGGTVTTSGAQSYFGGVTLGADTTLKGTTLDLFGTVNGGGNNLALNNSGLSTLGAALSGVNTLAAIGGGSLSVLNTISAATVNDSEATAFNSGGTVTTTGTQTYNGAVTLGVGTTFSTSGAGANGDISFLQTVNGAQALAVNTAGMTTFGGAVGNNQALTSLTTDAAGTTALNGGTVNATTTDCKDDVTLGANTTLNGTTTTFEKTVNADLAANNRTLTVNDSGVTTFGGAVGNNQTLASVTTDAVGTTAINGGSVTTSGAQTYHDDVTLDAAGNATTLTGGAATFDKTVHSTTDGKDALTVNAGTTTFGGAVGGNNQRLASVATDANGTTALNGGSVTTTGGQTYNDDVTLGAATTLGSSGGADITFAKTVNGAQTLAVNTAGTTTFGGAVGNNQALASLTTFSLGGATAINGGTVTTMGAQSYNDNVTLGANTTLNGTKLNLFGAMNGGGNNLTLNNSGTTTLGDALSGVNALTANGSGNLVVNNTISAASVSDSEATALNGGTVTTTGTQTYNGALTLGADTILTSSGGSDITFAKTVDGAQSLAVNTSGNEIFNGIVGGNTALMSLTTDGSGTVGGGALLNGGSVTTTGGQTYNDNITLGANTTLNGTMLNLFGALTGGGNNLALNNSGAATLDGSLSGVNTLTASGSGNLVVNNAIATAAFSDSEATALNGGTVKTSGGQTYDENVTLGADTTLASSGGADITFAKTVDGAQALTVNTSGNEIFNGAVGGSTPLTSLTTDGSGTVGGSALLNGGSVTTTGGQTYNDNVTLGAATTLTSSGGANITFAKTVDGAQSLAVNTSGNEIFNGAVGGNMPLTSVTTDGSGTVGGSALLNGGSVTTIGSQTYNDNVTLGANTTLNGTAFNLFGAVSGGGNNLTLNNSGAATLDGPLSGVNALNFIGSGNLVANGAISAATINDSEPTALNGRSVATTGTQTYGNIVTLGANTTLSLSGLTFTGIGAIAGNGYPLIVNGVVYSVVGEDETLKRSLLGAILPTYHPIEVRARKPWQHKRSGIPPWSITDPMNSLQVPFD